MYQYQEPTPFMYKNRPLFQYQEPTPFPLTPFPFSFSDADRYFQIIPAHSQPTQ